MSEKRSADGSTAQGLVVLGTNTGVGKTWVSRAIARAWRRDGQRVLAVKPYETGCDPEALDAIAIAKAAQHEPPGGPWFRAAEPISPWASMLRNGKVMSPFETIAVALRACHRPFDASKGPHAGTRAERVLVETAGGVLSPLDGEHTNADLVSELGWPAVLITANRLGTLSTTWTALESLARRNVQVQALVAVRTEAEDASCRENLTLLASRSLATCLDFRQTADDDEVLADEAVRCGLLRALSFAG